MASPSGFSSAPSKMGQEQTTAIRSVDLVALTAQGYTRQQTQITIDLRYYVGGVHVIPSVGDQWIVRRFGTNWILVSQLPYMAAELGNVADTKSQGTVQIGSSNPNGLGPLYLNGSVVYVRAPMSVAAIATADQPAATTVAAGTIIYDTNLNQLVYSDGTAWQPIGTGSGSGGHGGDTVAWTDITGKPSTFPPTVPIDWDDISGEPTNFPTNWASITGKPTTFPPTPPTGVPDGTQFWRDDFTWAVPAGTGGGGGSTSSDLVTGETPTGSINGTNLVFTLANTYQSVSTMVYLNGIRAARGTDYTETAGNTLTFTTAPLTGDHLMVDYTVTSALSLITGEVPSGTKNGTNVTFTLANPYLTGSTSVFRNGLREQLGTGYTEAGGSTLTFTTAPLSSDILAVDYQF